jgi:murein DD-endopeptidase MepM/ murein hydrolase activator NlpD
LAVAALIGVVGYAAYRRFAAPAGHFALLRDYWADPILHDAWAIRADTRCGEAPFLIPTDGFIAFFWGDRYLTGRRHQGIDIFGPTGPDGLGETPVVAAYDGYLTRLPEWRSAVIVRHARDPLMPGRQIWTYYAHMADLEGRSYIEPRFPPGTHEVFVPAGELLGYQGNYSGDPGNPTGMHLHFSIVRDNGQGKFLNELDIGNTLDPSSYLGIVVNGERVGAEVAVCRETE